MTIDGISCVLGVLAGLNGKRVKPEFHYPSTWMAPVTSHPDRFGIF